MKSRLRILPVIWLVGLLALPCALRALGLRQHPLENTAQAPYPAVGFGSLTRRATFQQIDSALLDRLPLRAQALNFYGNVELLLFHESPDPRIALGKRGWLYYVPETQVCSADGQPLIDPQMAADAADVLARTLVASGRNTTVVFAGSKYVTHKKDAPSIAPAVAACASTLDHVIQDRLGSTPGGLDLEPALEQLEREGKQVFLKNDSHWNWRGREVFTRLVLDRVRPGLAEAVGLQRGPDARRTGDLAKIMGVTRDEQDPTLVTARKVRNPPPVGDVLLIGDSQMERSLLDPTGVPGVAPIRDAVLPDQPSCNWVELAGGQCDAQIRSARTIVVESVSRDISYFAAYCWRPIELVAERMRGAPGAWERVDGGPPVPGGALTIPATGSVSVRVHPEDGDVAAAPRLLRLAIVHLAASAAGAAPAVALTQQPQAGPPLPCATPTQGTEGGALFVPVPSGRSTNDLVFTLTGAPGTRLAAPQTIRLDGRARP